MRQSRKTNPKPRDALAEYSPVCRVRMSRNVRFLYKFPVSGAKKTTYMLSAELMQRFGIKGPMLLAVESVGELMPGMVLLYSEGRNFDVGRLVYDCFTDLFAIEKGEYDFVFLSDANVLGEPVGYCGIGEIDRDLLKFRKFQPFRWHTTNRARANVIHFRKSREE